MSEPFIGEIRMVGFNFAPRGWAFCQGQLLSIAQNSALFSLLGTTYGGNGQTTFGLPDLRGRVPVGQGSGPGLQPVVQGEMAGTQTVTLNSTQMPVHNHIAQFTPPATPVTAQVNVTDTVGTLRTAAGNLLAQTPGAGPASALIYAPADSPVSGQLSGVSLTGPIGGSVTVAAAGGSQPFSVLQPYLGINFIIALEGIFPSRN